MYQICKPLTSPRNLLTSHSFDHFRPKYFVSAFLLHLARRRRKISYEIHFGLTSQSSVLSNRQIYHILSKVNHFLTYHSKSEAYYYENTCLPATGKSEHLISTSVSQKQHHHANFPASFPFQFTAPVPSLPLPPPLPLPWCRHHSECLVTPLPLPSLGGPAPAPVSPPLPQLGGGGVRSTAPGHIPRHGGASRAKARAPGWRQTLFI